MGEPEGGTEMVAYKLLVHIAAVEGKDINSHGRPDSADRKWILDAFAQCQKAVSGRWVQRGPRQEDVIRTETSWPPTGLGDWPVAPDSRANAA